jgi:hypothetical protein
MWRVGFETPNNLFYLLETPVEGNTREKVNPERCDYQPAKEWASWSPPKRMSTFYPIISFPIYRH